MRKLFPVPIALLVVLVFAAVGMADQASIYLRNTSNPRVFEVWASNLKDVGAIELAISYDTNFYANPVPNWGEFAAKGMTTVNPNIPGMLRMAIMSTSPIENSGLMATISFDLKGAGGAPPTLSRATVVSTAASELPISTMGPKLADPQTGNQDPNPVSDGSDGDKTDPPAGGGGYSGLTSAGISGPTYVGNVDLPTAQEWEKTKTEDKAPEETAAVEQPEPVVAGTAPAPEEKLAESPEASGKEKTAEEKYVSHKSVIQRFKEYGGERTQATLTALFAAPIPGFSQEPSIAVADGITPVMITVKVPGGKSPNFSLKGARLLSLASMGDGSWVVEARPEKGVHDARLTVIQGKGVAEYPLTVTPLVALKEDTKAKPTAADFALFLKEPEAGKGAMDLNRDGKRDYVDDYIYAANYLLLQTGRKTGTPERAQRVQTQVVAKPETAKPEQMAAPQPAASSEPAAAKPTKSDKPQKPAKTKKPAKTRK